MKTHSVMLHIPAVLLATVLSCDVPAYSQPANPPNRPARINPVTGRPVSDPSELNNLPRIDPATGLPAAKPGELTAEGGVNEGYQVANEVRHLLLNRRYEEALRRCLAFHDRWQTSASLLPLLQDWVELGRRYPEAKTALLQIRDHGVREFSEGRGYFALFMEVSSINNGLHQDDATYELFRSFRDKDPALAQQCYGMVEGLLVAKGEHQWVYEHMGDPQAKFEGIRRNMDERLERYKRSQESNQATRRRIQEENVRRGLTNLPSFTPADVSDRLTTAARDGFVGQTRQLIEVLVATGHSAEAEKIRSHALKVMEDERLKSAISDAEVRIKALRSANH